MTISPHRLRARRFIASILVQLPPDATEQDCRKALRGRWPKSPSHPYQMFLKEVLVALRARFGRRPKDNLEPLRVLALPDGVLCDWCKSEGCIACSQITRERSEFLAVDPARLDQWWAFHAQLLRSPDDAVPRLILADWLEENGWPEQADRERQTTKEQKTP